jgi:multiple sugar transport system permease protein
VRQSQRGDAPTQRAIVPQYLLLARVGLAGTYWSVLPPVIINPFGIFLCRVFASAAVPQSTLEALSIPSSSTSPWER